LPADGYSGQLILVIAAQSMAETLSKTKAIGVNGGNSGMKGPNAQLYRANSEKNPKRSSHARQVTEF
jgi:hypothetical protein